MAAQLTRLLTTSTVVSLIALLVLMIADGLTPASLERWTNPVAWGLAVLILVRVATRAGAWRKGIAGPLAGSASVQSRLFGFSPGSSTIEQPTAPAYTISDVEDEENSRRIRDGESG